MVGDLVLRGEHTEQCGQQGSGRQDPFRSAALEGQLGGHLAPPVADFAEEVGVVDEDLLETDLVEVVFTRHQHDRADRDSRRIGGHDELTEAGMAARGVHGAGSGQDHDLMAQMRSAGPDLGSGQHPATIGAGGARGGCRQVRTRLRLTHPDRREVPSRSDSRQNPLPLLLGAVGDQPRCHLSVGDPVRRHRRAGGQQFLGDDVAVEMAEAVAAVLDRDGQADKAGVAQAGAEVLVPLRQPGVHRRLPPVLCPVGSEELPNGGAQGGEIVSHR